MKKSTIAALALATAGACAFCACSGRGESTPDKTTVTTTESDGTISFTRTSNSSLYTLPNTAKLFGNDSDILFSGRTDMLLPDEYSGTTPMALRDSVMKTAFGSTGADFKTSSHAFFEKCVAETGYDNFKAAPEGTQLPKSGMYGEAIVNGFIEYATPEIMSYGILKYIYAPGAAHGMTTTAYVNFDFDSGKVVTLNDIFTAEGLKALPDILKKQATSMESAIGPTELSALPSGDTFCFGNNYDIIFVYQPYEIASYAQGTIRLSLPTYDLSQYMTPYGKKLFNLI